MKLIYFLTIFYFVKGYFIHEPPFEKLNDNHYWDTWVFRKSNYNDTWKTIDKIIYYNNKPFKIKGTNFNGIESDCRVPLGFFTKPLDFFINFLVYNKFNSVRIPISYEVMNNMTLEIGDCVQAEPLFHKGMPVENMIKILLDKFYEKKIFLLFDMHTIDGVITPSPWTETVNEDMVVNAWLQFIDKFKEHPGFMGIEIKNEPHKITLDRFLQYCAKVIYNVEKNIHSYNKLYFISGVQIKGPWGGSFDHSLSTFNGFTHPNILCTVDTPVDKFILNPHVYGTSVRGHDVAYENDTTWEESYGFITSMSNHWNMSAIIPTEWGGKLIGDDADYYNRWLTWHVEKKNLTAGGYFWTLAPYSIDTGGIFDDNYNVDWNKITFINRLTPTRSNLRGI